MDITTFKVKTCMGQLTSYGNNLDFLTDEEKKEFDTIGYTGKDSNGNKTDTEKYLNSLNKGVFKVVQTKFDFGDFCEEFMVIRVI